MDLTLYGICFKMNGGPELLEYAAKNVPIPVTVMQQVMDQVGSVTQEELGFAKRLADNWKKAFNEKVSLVMDVAEDGGYEIICTVPDELLESVSILTGLEDSKIVEEYTSEYLKSVCGIKAEVISVDVDSHEGAVLASVPDVGFDIGDLGTEPEGPAFEDIATFGMDGDMEISQKASESGTETFDMLSGMPAEAGEIPEAVPPFEEQGFAQDIGYREDTASDMEDSVLEGMEYQEEDAGYQKEDMPSDMEGYSDAGYMDEAPFDQEEAGYVEEEPVYAEDSGDSGDVMKNAMVNIYTELVGNIRDRKLDERLNLRIG